MITAWLAIEVACAVVVGVALLRELPTALRPWAAAAYALFLPLVLELTLGNVDLISVGFALLAWHWRDRPLRAAIPLALAVGLKLLPAALLFFYLASGRWRVVVYAAAAGCHCVVKIAPGGKVETVLTAERPWSPTGVAVHAAGTYVTGFTNSSDFPIASPTQPAIGGVYDGFVARFVGADVDLDYSTWLGGSGIDSAFGIVVDAGGNAYVMGLTDSSDFPIINAFQTSYGGGTADLFVAKVKAGPTVSRAEIQGKNLLVFGNGFDAGARILLEGEPQKTRNDEVTPAGILLGKKVGKKIAQGTTVTVQVRNSDGTLSNQLRFTRP